MTIDDIHKRVHDLFTWKSDPETFDRPEYWKSFVQEAYDNIPFEGDCDDFALTCAEMLINEGYDPSMTYIGMVCTETGVLHLVTVYDQYLLDNRYPYVMDVRYPDYTWIKGMWMDEVGVWRTIQYK